MILKCLKNTLFKKLLARILTLWSVNIEQSENLPDNSAGKGSAKMVQYLLLVQLQQKIIQLHFPYRFESICLFHSSLVSHLANFIA